MDYKIYELITNNFKIIVYKSNDIIRIKIFNIVKNLYYEIFVESRDFYITYEQYPSLAVKNIVTLFVNNKIELHLLGNTCKIDEIEHILELLNCKDELKTLDEKHKKEFINGINQRINSLKTEIEFLEEETKKYLKSHE